MDPSSCSEYSSRSPPTANVLVGWVPESTGRGSLSIVLSSLTTLFLCTWVVIHARVYERPLVQWLHKFALLLKAVIAPEFIAVEGLQEWIQAQKMTKNCAIITGGELKLIHGFYISMLALKYRTPRGKKVIWPNQYTWLLRQGLIDWRHHSSWGLSEGDIRDRSNADGFAKLLALGQVSWFVAQSIMRRAHELPLSQLETMTLSYIPLVAITYFFWWVKPKDITRPSVVDLPDMLPAQKATFESMAVSNAFDDEGIGKQDSLWTIWYLTPRVFEKEAEEKALEEEQQKAGQKGQKLSDPSKIQQNAASGQEKEGDLELQHAARLEEAWKGPAKEIVVAYWDPDAYHSKFLWPIICLFGASFGALHLLAWKTVFPTSIEQWLWRVAALVSIFSMLIFMQFEKVVVRWGGPLTIISLVSPVLYLLSRIAMIGGVIAAFRASEPGIYDTYSVSTYWIHIL